MQRSTACLIWFFACQPLVTACGSPPVDPCAASATDKYCTACTPWLTTPQVVSAHKMRHPRFARLAAKMARAAPPCTADDGDWRGAAGWLDEGDVPESDAALHAAPMPDFTRKPAALRPA